LHIRLDEAVCADFAEGGHERFEIGAQIGRVLIQAGSASERGERVGGMLDRKAGEQEINVLTPGLVAMRSHDHACGTAEGIDGSVASRRERWRRGLHPGGEAEFLAESTEFAMQDEQGIDAKAFESFRRHGSRHAGMSVTVPTDPGAEGEPRQIRGFRQRLGRKPGVAPCLSEAFIKLRQHPGKHVPQVVQYIAAFIGERRFFEEDFARAPKPFESGLDGLAMPLDPGGG
jgi:hypothetical protein